MGIVTKVVPDEELANASLALATRTGRRRTEGACGDQASGLERDRHQHRAVPLGGSANGLRTVRYGRRPRGPRRRHRTAQAELYGTLAGAGIRHLAIRAARPPPCLRLGRGEGHRRGDRAELCRRRGSCRHRRSRSGHCVGVWPGRWGRWLYSSMSRMPAWCSR